VLAEVTAREIGRVTIAEALELTALRRPTFEHADRFTCIGRCESELEGGHSSLGRAGGLATRRPSARGGGD
jgi:hypothetical protein